jgi:hypothetical protein
MWMHHAKDPSWGTRPSKQNIWFVSNTIIFYWEDHNTSIRSVFKVNENLMKSLFDKLLNIYGPTSISCIKAFKSSQQAADFSIGCCDIVLRLTFTLGTFVQVRAHPSHVENTSKMPKEDLLLGHLRRLVWVSKSS